jgi:hypothetical protein
MDHFDAEAKGFSLLFEKKTIPTVIMTFSIFPYVACLDHKTRTFLHL